MSPFFNQISNIVGISGVGLVLLAYFLLNISYLSSKSLSYQLLNFFGAWLILFSLFFHWNLASVLIEIAWILISAVGVYSYVKQQRGNAC